MTHPLLIMAGCLTTMLGIVHSLVGERRVLKALAAKRGAAGEPLLSSWYLGVLRGTWHTLSLFGFGLAFVLFTLGVPVLERAFGVTGAIALSCAIVGAYWAYVTHLWHPAWIVFMVVSLLCWAS